MNSKLILTSFLSIFISCQSHMTDVERISIVAEVIVSDLETSMPGQLRLTENHLLWTDPFNHEFGAHIVDKITGRELNKIAPKGNGPEEFVTPNISTFAGNSFFLYDYNSYKFFFISGDGSIQRKINWNSDLFQHTTRIIPLSENAFITFVPSSEKPFALINDKGEVYSSFGKTPFEKGVDNSYDMYQGEVLYHPIKKVLVYSTYTFPYIALYSEKENKFVFENEILQTNDCEIVKGELKCNRSKRGAAELALTKDFIVTLERDYQMDSTDETNVGRDFSKLPQTVFLYDYKLKLKKIVNVGMPIIRLTADPLTNDIYAIGINPDFVIVKLKV